MNGIDDIPALLQDIKELLWGIALLLTGGVMGFAGVVQAAPGFQYFLDFAMSADAAEIIAVAGAVSANA